jgi:adenosine deaminase/aminodeoxyfutalosine deaminase
MDRPSSFLVTLPKAELHLHLEGSIDPTTLVELRRRHGKTSTLAEIEQLYRYEDFNGFLMAFKAVTEDLQTPDDYELITYRMMERLKAENALHAEVYVSVGVCLWRKQDFDAIFEGLDREPRKVQATTGVSPAVDLRCSAPVWPRAAREVFGTAVRYRDREVVVIGIGA